MMATTHALVGTAIAIAVHDPLEAGILIVVSHYILDLIPHWDFGTDWKKRSVAKTGALSITDTLCSYVLTLFLFANRLPPVSIFLAASLANLPDWLIAPYFMFFSSKEGYHRSRGGTVGKLYGNFLAFEEHYIHTTTTFMHGVLTQLAIVFFFYLLLVNK